MENTIELHTGTINYFNVPRGYGFIQPDNGENIFFHCTGLQDKKSIVEGDRVQFTIGSRDGKPIAKAVSKI
jgi:CspA family cold shock protein